MNLAKQMYEWGPRGVSLFAALVSLLGATAVALLIYTNAPTVLGVDIKPGDTVRVTPAYGPEGFLVSPFCADPTTKLIARDPIPLEDRVAFSYTLERWRGLRQELVVWSDTGRGAEHWHYTDELVDGNGDGVPESFRMVKEPAFVDNQARDCIESRELEE